MAKEKTGVPKICYSVREAAEAVGVSEDKIREYVGRDDFPAFRFGGRWVIPVSELVEWASVNARGGSYERNC